ncbi:MAG: DUF4922 domain-containing protein [Acidobacteria bacterium]|nr:DUF4922 domain-containing protein [Acidobacteriota bacterium]
MSGWAKRIVETPAGVDPLLALARRQEAEWPQLAGARRRWVESRYREIRLGAFSVFLQFNPSREVNVLADPSPASVRERPCFLCEVNLPPEERGVDLGHGLLAFLNPFPIFYPHPTLIHREHRPQAIAGFIGPMLDLAARFAGRWTLLYNGPRCGASAPDHLHFQAFPRYATPLETDRYHVRRKSAQSAFLDPLPPLRGAELYTLRDYNRLVLVLESPSAKVLAEAFTALADALPRLPAGGDAWAPDEPPVNLAAWAEPGGGLVLCVFPRTRHRPAGYHLPPEAGGRLVSPGLIDLAGVVVTPRRHDFETLTAAEIEGVFAEVCPPVEDIRAVVAAAARRGVAAGGEPAPPADRRLPSTPSAEPELRVGLAEDREALSIRLDGAWRLGGETLPPGAWCVRPADGRLRLESRDGCRRVTSAPARLEPAGPQSRFLLESVAVGLDFHWEFREDLVFEGALEVLERGGRLTAVNRVPLERYLESVIASEMHPDAPEAFLEAHAVISRSWVLAQLLGRAEGEGFNPAILPPLDVLRWRWTDRQRHGDFDVCNDDHCQRYQGVLRVSNPTACGAIRATRGQVVHDGVSVVDTRFSKCCGGVSEVFRSAWGDVNLPGLVPVRDDWPGGEAVPDLTTEGAARAWIEASPEACCNTRDEAVLRRVLPGFDRATTDFYRWERTVPRGELDELVRSKGGWDPGRLLAIVPLQRGASGRLVRVLLRGEAGDLVVGKELEIRRVLSRTHLFSSAFTAEAVGDDGGAPAAFRFRGAGWGHGVGLCQIGAAVMACRGADAATILARYFPGTTVERLYD